MSSPNFGFAAAAQVLASQPFNSLVGATIERFGGGGAVLELEIRDCHRQQYGIVHGGVVAYLVDNSLTFACGTVLGADIITRSVSVTYLAAARAGLLRATATVASHEPSAATATVVVHNVMPDGTERECAVGQGSAVVTGGRPS
ncbi:PaaI family thioesterase [Gordonia sp. PDNC005]|uniref:PaaI family thioesterase n=1 Tax=unclassified Gordonia (in: high G+C Gram-positive bacteria) TaxID=2657482 RepID=UPI001965C52B|nr:PaaI family thioesterase [Gordonia sp. PDNC005]QRY63263.1 PaaI family thioesterase [Gordonia sp. PDNC005]